jgi:hypothetical protein
MRDLFVDVLLEIPVADLRHQADPTRYLYERMRHRADEICHENGGRLRTDRAPEVHIRQGKHPLLGFDMTLVASRWAVTAPERVASEAR